uniref:Uncharacterized protein n=1 Tax=Cryptococcus bacillisporus CA1280 TaxID=1296109 RepID=A0A0D0VGJ3_CRYGA|nr:hypothetical protein I312_06823 [Cryptococcus bacillisporus CA1280]
MLPSVMTLGGVDLFLKSVREWKNNKEDERQEDNKQDGEVVSED